MLTHCPECTKTISETASTCPSCGFTFTAGVTEVQKAQKQRDEKIATWVTAGFFVVVLVLCSGIFTSSSKLPPASTAIVESNPAIDAARLHELGQKTYLTRSEIREFLILGARQAVREGEMSRSGYEQWTGEPFPN